MLSRWIRRIPLSLARKYLLGVVAGLVASFALFAALFLLIYQSQLQMIQSHSAHQSGRMLLVALQHPMAENNEHETSALVRYLGRSPEIHQVMVSDLSGTIRYASNAQMQDRNLLAEGQPGCMSCHSLAPEDRPDNLFVHAEDGTEILRSIVPIASFDCDGCPRTSDPMLSRGMVVVDYLAAPLREQTRETTLFLMGAGAFVLFITLLGGWWFMRNIVLSPLHRLRAASEAVGGGDLTVRTPIEGTDEIAGLGQAFNDMTANLERAMHDIAMREAFQQALIDGIPDGVRVIDRDFRIVTANHAFADQVGIPLQDLTGEHCYHASHGRDAPCPATLVNCPLRQLSQANSSIKFIDTHRNVDGGEFQVEVYAAHLSVTREGVEEEFIIESIRNLTEEIHFSHEQKLSDIGQLAAGVAHEIRNPLTTLKMALPHLEDADAPLEHRQEYLQLIEQEVERCLNVSDRLLQLSALPPSHSELVDINVCVSETLSLLRFEAEQRGVDLQLELDPSQPRCIATDNEIRMVVLNLVQNAFHAAPGKGTVRVSTRIQPNAVQIVVDDNGPGIPPEKIATVFEPFYSERRDHTRGTGLGLPISHSLVKRHGGSIRIEPSPVGGARLVVTLEDADRKGTETQ